MLPLQFGILTVTGAWCHPTWTSILVTISYRFYSFLINMVMIALAIMQVAHLVHVIHDFDEFNDNVTVAVSVNFGWVKGIILIFTQKRILLLIHMFETKCCTVQSFVEERIQKKYNHLCRLMALVLLILVEITALSVVLIPLNSGVDTRELIYKVKVPYNLTVPKNYWFSYIHQIIVTLYTPAISITVDALIAGYMLQVCCQIEFLKCRLKHLPSIIGRTNAKIKCQIKRKSLERQLKNFLICFLTTALYLYFREFRLAESICSTFYEIVVSQFFVSAFAICVTVYQLSVMSNKIEILSYFLYFLCLLQQFFLYCFFGNEITLQSISLGSAIFSIDWTVLSPTLLKDLSMIIARTYKPIDMSCGPFIHLTLESFSKILKLSYSAFNFLKQSTS